MEGTHIYCRCNIQAVTGRDTFGICEEGEPRKKMTSIWCICIGSHVQ